MKNRIFNVYELSELINKTKRYPDKDDVDYEALAEDFETECYSEFYNTDKRITAYEVLSWCCTDTSVGMNFYYFDDQFVAYSWQPDRKSDTEFYWVDVESYEKVRDYLISYIPKRGKPALIKDQPESKNEVEEFYKMDALSIYNNGRIYYQGELVKLVPPYQHSWNDDTVHILYKGETIKVQAKELDLRINLKD